MILPKMEEMLSRKVARFGVKVYRNRQHSIKASELEDQCAIGFGLALWPHQPRAIDLLKHKCISQKRLPTNAKHRIVSHEVGLGLR